MQIDEVQIDFPADRAVGPEWRRGRTERWSSRGPPVCWLSVKSQSLYITVTGVIQSMCRGKYSVLRETPCAPLHPIIWSQSFTAPRFNRPEFVDSSTVGRLRLNSYNLNLSVGQHVPRLHLFLLSSFAKVLLSATSRLCIDNVFSRHLQAFNVCVSKVSLWDVTDFSLNCGKTLTRSKSVAQEITVLVGLNLNAMRGVVL